MLITNLYCDNWIGVDDNELRILNPSWDDIHDVVRSLDGENKTMAKAEIDEEKYVMVGGGSNNKYIVIISLNEDESYHISNINDLTQMELLTIGGQTGEYSVGMIVSIDTALKAVRFFAKNGNIDPSINWFREY